MTSADERRVLRDQRDKLLLLRDSVARSTTTTAPTADVATAAAARLYNGTTANSNYLHRSTGSARHASPSAVSSNKALSYSAGSDKNNCCDFHENSSGVNGFAVLNNSDDLNDISRYGKFFTRQKDDVWQRRCDIIALRRRGDDTDRISRHYSSKLISHTPSVSMVAHTYSVQSFG